MHLIFANSYGSVIDCFLFSNVAVCRCFRPRHRPSQARELETAKDEAATKEAELKTSKAAADAAARADVAAEAETRALMVQVADLNKKRTALRTENDKLVSKVCRCSVTSSIVRYPEGGQMLRYRRAVCLKRPRAKEHLRPSSNHLHLLIK